MEKVKKKQVVAFIEPWEIDGLNLEKVVEVLLEKMPSSSVLDWDGGSLTFDIVVDREETDDEFEIRKKVAEENLKRTEEKERAELAKLIAKYK